MPDALSILLRGLSFIALFQSIGAALFVDLFGRPLTVSLPPIRRVARVSAAAALVLLLGQYLLEAARMADAMTGMFDASLQRLVFESPSSLVLLLRVVGMCLAIAAFHRRGSVGHAFTLSGVLLVAVSFALLGHTAASPWRMALAALLTGHVLLVSFWFGALAPLYLIVGAEPRPAAAALIVSFTRGATWLVPVILVAGISMALALINPAADLLTGYGLSLIAKLMGFTILMAFAAVNKWRLAPAIATGDPQVRRAFRRSLACEYALICVVLGITAAMTTLYSPESD
jgi:putative copper resistance protein D